MTMTAKETGEIIKSLRKNSIISVSEFADQVGIKRQNAHSQISRICKGSACPSTEKMDSYLKVFGKKLAVIDIKTGEICNL